MRWKRGRRSSNVEDRRGATVRRAGVVGGGGVILALVLSLVFGIDPSAVLGGGSQGAVTESRGEFETTAAEDELVEFVKVVLADTEDTWGELFREMGQSYQKPRLVLFRDAVESACGFADAAVGPFYCPADGQVYLDLSFFGELQRNLGASGDFAQAYVIAHEIGHHVQNLLGISERVQAKRAQLDEVAANELSVRLELQADFFAGLWAHHAHRMRGVLEPGDLEEALRAAAAIGDDRLQKQARGYVTPDSFTHGTSEQRMRWFRRGFETGDLSQGDTFGAKKL